MSFCLSYPSSSHLFFPMVALHFRLSPLLRLPQSRSSFSIFIHHFNFRSSFFVHSITRLSEGLKWYWSCVAGAVFCVAGPSHQFFYYFEALPVLPLTVLFYHHTNLSDDRIYNLPVWFPTIIIWINRSSDRLILKSSLSSSLWTSPRIRNHHSTTLFDDRFVPSLFRSMSFRLPPISWTSPIVIFQGFIIL